MSIYREPNPELLDYRKRIAGAKRIAKANGHTMFLLDSNLGGWYGNCGDCRQGMYVPRYPDESTGPFTGLAVERSCEERRAQ